MPDTVIKRAMLLSRRRALAQNWCRQLACEMLVKSQHASECIGWQTACFTCALLSLSKPSPTAIRRQLTTLNHLSNVQFEMNWFQVVHFCAGFELTQATDADLNAFTNESLLDPAKNLN